MIPNELEAIILSYLDGLELLEIIKSDKKYKNIKAVCPENKRSLLYPVCLSFNVRYL